ncbi:right-handed parallel beta-helix repeat-containing protein [Foetidibacter luteolus]|uniref:right-handed parallel beta-helix repeat-containing protein n=1 Tax=Foetidibacter luteolus TaxID=2608880 RepID=UPI00129B6FA0|nr:right-handed parallel beta-helix repeat-containing protein [Foetidibacter luteolus]
MKNRILRMPVWRLVQRRLFLPALLAVMLCSVNSIAQTGKTFTVNITGDQEDFDAGNFPNDNICDVDAATPGEQCSFRAAIQNHNNNRNLDLNKIFFNIPGAPGTGSIVIMVGSTGLGPLPPVLGAVSIQALNQGGRRIELNGSQAGSNAIGLQLLGGNCSITFFVINSFSSHGIYIAGTPPPGEGKHVIMSNFIGTDGEGLLDKGNGGDGILIDNTPGNQLGGSASLDRNIISANKGYGVHILGRDQAETGQPNGAHDNLVLGNLVGTDFFGDKDLPNAKGGILNETAPNNTIGGDNAGAGNTVRGVKNGIWVEGSLSKGVKVLGNFIGKDGTTAKFTAGIFARSGEQLSVQGNILTNIDSVGIDIYLDANGNYNILKNSITGKVKAGTKFTFGTGRTIDVNYSNNIHYQNTTGLQIEESLNSTINWLIAGDSITAGHTGANITFRAAGKKDLNGNRWNANAGVGFKYVADLSPAVQASLLFNGDVFAGNGEDGFSGKVQLQAQADFFFSMLNTSSTGNGKDGISMGLFATAGAEADIIFGGGNDYGFNAGLGGRIVGEKTSIDVFKFTLEKNGIHDNIEGGWYFFDIKAKFSVTENQVANNKGPGFILAGSSELRIDSNTITGNTIGVLSQDAAIASFGHNSITGNGKGIVLTGAGIGSFINNNSIYNNTGLGIDLGNDGITSNDAGDADTGPNNLQNFPVLTAANLSGGNLSVQGTLNSLANALYQIDFYANAICNASGAGEGQLFVGTHQVTTGANGNAAFNVQFNNVTLPANAAITATATSADNNTSEFSACIATGGTVLNADLELVKSADKTTLATGADVVFTLKLVNKGPAAASNITVQDVLPAGLSFKQAVATSGTYNNATGNWHISNLGNGATASLSITATATLAGSYTNTAQVTATTPADNNTANNKSSITIQVTDVISIADQLRQLRQQVVNLFNNGELTVLQSRLLTGLLDLALGFNSRNYRPGTIASLRAFIFFVQRFTLRPRLTRAHAKELTDAARKIIAQLLQPAAPGARQQHEDSTAITSYLEKYSKQPAAVAEIQGCYPNPFTSFINIAVNIQKPCWLTLRMYDAGGKTVAALAGRFMQPGRHNIYWNNLSVAPGMYYIAVYNGQAIQTYPVICIK